MRNGEYAPTRLALDCHCPHSKSSVSDECVCRRRGAATVGSAALDCAVALASSPAAIAVMVAAEEDEEDEDRAGMAPTLPATRGVVISGGIDAFGVAPPPPL
jgi:hypothetical protein